MKPLVLAILDGWGYSLKRAGNPLLEARKPNLDYITNHYPLLLLQASGLAVGLNWGDFGNSEVGHLTIGAGRTVQQYSTRIGRAIKDGSFFSNKVLVDVFSHPRVHIIGLLTAGNVHADLSHLQALIEMGTTSQIFLHLFTDGKDSGIHDGAGLLKKLPVSPTTIIGRNHGMDRDKNWDLTQQAYDLIALAKGEKTEDFTAKIEELYKQGTPDTKIPALAATTYEGTRPGDAFFFFNFREDSIRQLYSLFPDAYTMTKYTDKDERFLFGPPELNNNLSELISKAGLTQLHIAETVKYAHVTYFFNGLKNEPYENENDVLIQSVKDIEAEPTMGAENVANRIVAELPNYDVIVANFANADMLAHTGNYEATRTGVETVDNAVGIIMDAVLAQDGILLITSDHGNAEALIDRFTSEPESRHDGSPVPIYFIGNQYNTTNYTLPTEPDGILADVAPTILELMGIPQPIEMTGVSLLPKLPARDTTPQTDQGLEK
ncbi:MAG: 2,3-bisphosphoglycerate-independent phosphoglycerate mutase [Patescibacteria group bacterium]